MTDVYIISGFLGAGKTTWIQKMLKEAFSDKMIVLIENDFGEISLDAALLRGQGLEVDELNSGCICCGLSGDFVKAIQDILKRFAPDILLIEPSGVGKLSDVLSACRDEQIAQKLRVGGSITVADSQRFDMYLENFGEFYEDQLRHADLILLSRAQEHPEKARRAAESARGINPHAPIISKAWDDLPAQEAFGLLEGPGEPFACGHTGCDHDHVHDHHHHHHNAEDNFDTLTLNIKKPQTKQGLQEAFERLAVQSPSVIRAKGIVPGEGGGYLEVQYISGRADISPSGLGGGSLTLIGQGLEREQLAALFSAARQVPA